MSTAKVSVARCRLLRVITALALLQFTSSDDGIHSSVDGGWSPWQVTQECTVSCGGGKLIQKRQCNDPVPQGSGKNCTGVSQDISTVKCNSIPCPFTGYDAILQKMNVQSSAAILQNFTNSLIRQNLMELAGESTLGGLTSGWQTCSAVGDPHYTTFDGRSYSDYTSSSCRYYALLDRSQATTYPRFSLIVETGPCGGTCIHKFTLYISPCDPLSGSAISDTATTVDFLSDGRVLKNGENIGNTLPDTVLDSFTTISRAGGQTTLSSSCYGIEVAMPTPYSLYIRASPSLRGQVLGLCGTYDGNQATDFTLIDGRNITSSQTEFVQSYLLPSSGSSCKGPPLPPSCGDDLSSEPAVLCNAMNRGNFAVCNDPGICSSPKKPVAPYPYIDNCIVDVCQCPEAERARCACAAYIPYAIQCRENCYLQIDLTGFPGCEVPVVELHPSYRSVWQGYPTSFQCIAAAGWPIGPLEFSINGRDIDTMSNVSVDCLTTANCTLLISRAIAGQDNGTISCCLDNTVGEDCKTAQLDIKLGAFLMNVNSKVLVGSRVYPTVTKTPKDNPVQNVIVELVTSVSKETVTELIPSVPAQGKFKWDLYQLPKGADFEAHYRLRVWDRLTLFEGFSNSFTFIRDVIHTDVPVDKQGNTLVPPVAFLGQKTRFAFDYSHGNIFMQYVNMSLLNANGTAVANIGMFSAPRDRRPRLQSWIPGISGDLPNDMYRLYAKDSGTTGAEGTSASFEILHGSLCIIVASHIIYGGKTDVLWEVKPNLSIFKQLRFHVVEADDCKAEVADVTDEIITWAQPRAIWLLSTVIPNVETGQQYRLRASTSAPTHLQTCSQNTIAFYSGRISVSVATVSNVVYVDETYLVTFRVPRNLVLVSRVSVAIHCYGISKTWILKAAISNCVGKVLWRVGHEEVRDPVSYGHICYASVNDIRKTGATGRSQNVTVAKACVITDPDVKTGSSIKISVQFQPSLNLSLLVVQLVNQSNTSIIQLVYPSSDITVGDNALTVQNARVPDINGRSTAETFTLRVYNTRDRVAGYSQPVTFRGWALEAKIFDLHYDEITANHPVERGSIIRLRFCVPPGLTHLAGVSGYNFYEYYLATNNSGMGLSKITVHEGDTDKALVNCSHVVKAVWTGEPFGFLPLGHYSLVVRDKPQQEETYLIEAQTKEFEIIESQVHILPVIDTTADPSNENGKQSRNGSKAQSSSDDTGGGLSEGAIVGIIVGVVVFSLIILVAVIIHRQRKKLRGTYTRLQQGKNYGGVEWNEDHGDQTE